MYPGTIFNWYDESRITQYRVEDTYVPANLFLVGASFDRGPEDLRVINGQTFFDLYGTPDFDKHGQAAIQAANIIRGGGTLLLKRVVSKTATLANVSFIATVKKSVNAVALDENATDEDKANAKTMNQILGKEETDENATKYKTYDSINVSWSSRSFQNATTIDDVREAVTKLSSSTDPTEDGDGYIYTNSDGDTIAVTKDTITTKDDSGAETSTEVYKNSDGEVVYRDDQTPITSEDVTASKVISSSETIPMLIVCDNGRGVSKKSIKISPDYNTSRNTNYFFYDITIYLGTAALENVVVSFDPSTIVNDISYAINNYSSSQVILEQPEDSWSRYLALVADSLGATTDDDIDKISGYDLINGRSTKNTIINGFTIDPESIDLNSDYGVGLEQGSNGGFGDYPNPGNPVDDKYSTDPSDRKRVKKDYVDALTWFFYPIYEEDSTTSADYDYAGSDAVFDLDQYKIAACFDANYPDSVKQAISKLATFREDFFYFRDTGIKAMSYNAIKDIVSSNDSHYKNGFEINNRYIGNYSTWYQIIDPSSRRRIPVTMMYDFSRAMISHFANSPYKPLAGIVNNMILESAIDGTINFVPKITPLVNQKELMDDLRVNYAIFQNGRCVVQSLYTSQEAYTQLSYINNVLGIQQVIRAVREACPAMRYTFAQRSDFSAYASAVSNVLQNYSNNFAELSFDYREDALKASNKIFYATISFRFNNWVQTEIFDIYALPDNYTTSTQATTV